jgi:chemosensory pili system protein ChpA (sensor histidine kinase/response regulator)
MLNRVLDGSRPASHAVVSFVTQVRDALPQLLAALKGETAVNIDLLAMQAVADRLAAGEDVLLDVLPVGVAATAQDAIMPDQPYKVATWDGVLSAASVDLDGMGWTITDGGLV